MKVTLRSLGIMFALALVLGAVPVTAQDEAEAEQGTYCLRLMTTTSLAELDAAAIGQLLIDGEVQLELVDASQCESKETKPKADRDAKKATPYVKFVARGAGAALQLAKLAQKSENASGLLALDKSAKRLASWAAQQRKWLDKHPPEACYADAHASWREGVVRIREGALNVRKAVRQLEPAPMRQAVVDLAAGVASFDEVDLDAVSRTCLDAATEADATDEVGESEST